MNYLKIILTIIAFNLTIIMLQNSNIIPIAKADTHETIDVNIETVGGYSVYGGNLNVKVRN